MKKFQKLICWTTAFTLLTGCGSGAGKSVDASTAPAAPASSAAAPSSWAGEGAAEPDGGLREEADVAGTQNSEEYHPIEENELQSVITAPQSTFSVDVDTASYANLRRMLYDGGAVDPDAVRIEEMINYFQYDYPQPRGDDPFSITTEVSDCPWNASAKLMLVGLQARDVDYDSLPNSNLVFLLDVSGSMDEENKLPLVKKAFQMLSENLRAEDRISIVTYASQDAVVLDGVSGSKQKVITDALNQLSAGGSTAGSKGILRAYELAEKYFIDGGNNRIILATDGDLNVGLTSEKELTQLVEKKRDNGVFLTVLGFGEGNLKDNKMEALADHGNGNYAYIDSLKEASRVLVEQMGGTLFTAAKDVKVQVEFNPAMVSGYRLVGYENRLLKPADFTDDTKDAGEVGAGHRVTALYELTLTGSEGAPPLKYQPQAVSGGSDEWLTVSIRYKDPDGGESKQMERVVDAEDYTKMPPANLDFAAGVAQFGMLLRDSAYQGTSTYQEIYDRLSMREDVRMDEYKSELVNLVRLCAGRG